MQKHIDIPSTIGGERVVCVFPVIGDDGFVEAQVVTTNGEREPYAVYSVQRFMPRGGGGEIVVGIETPSFPTAIRHARKQAGWG